MWKIEKIVSKGDYNYCVVPNHPNANKRGYVLHHRVVVENHLNRILTSDEVVHHLNGKKKDNRLENLEVMAFSEHSKHHASESLKTFVLLKCPACKFLFCKPRHKTHLSKGGIKKLFKKM